MIKRIVLLGVAAWEAFLCPLAFAQSPPPGGNDRVEIRQVNVDGAAVPIHGKTVDLGAFPKSTIITFGPNTNSPMEYARIRYKLEPYETTWHDGPDDMFLVIRFYNDSGDLITQNLFSVHGESAGWDTSLKTSALTHRREMVAAPAQASRIMVVVSSAGPPTSVGVYVVANLKVYPVDAPGKILLESPSDREFDADLYRNRAGWAQDGLTHSMAKIVTIGDNPTQRALAILDDDPQSHAEWHNAIVAAPEVAPGTRLSLEWDEMYSIGDGVTTTAHYQDLAEGNYQFHVADFNIFGKQIGNETLLNVLVPPPFWRMAWFWSMVVILVMASSVGSWRYLVWHKVRREVLHLRNQQVLERERLRIAHDIHDDLGARVTQISLLSAMSQDNQAFPEKARADFDRISQMSRELVSALYQTVWAVNPENDNLEALSNYLCQMVNQLCERTPLRCRFHILELPREIQVSSQTRHNISMAVKEAVHNVIKHAKASEVTIRMTFSANIITILVQDDGCGFQAAESSVGHGLTNMKRRLEDMGGSCSIESQPGQGTTVHFQMAVKSVEKDS